MGTTSLQGNEDLIENLIGGLTSNTEDGVDIGVVAAAHSCDSRGELLVIKFTVSVGIELGEEGLELNVAEYATEGLEGFLEFTKLDSAESVKIEVLEDLLNGLALIVSTMGALSDFFENNVFKLFDSIGSGLHLRGSRETPCLQDEINEVIILLSGESSVDIGVVSDETLLRHDTSTLVFAEALDELNANLVALLFSGSHSGVGFNLVGSLELAPGNAAGTTLVERLPGVFHNG